MHVYIYWHFLQLKKLHETVGKEREKYGHVQIIYSLNFNAGDFHSPMCLPDMVNGGYALI